MTSNSEKQRSSERWYRTYAVELLLLILLWGMYTYFYQSTGTNEAVRFDQIRALVHDHTLVINKYCFNSPDLVGDPRGTSAIYPNKAPGMTFIGVIAFALLSSVFGWLKAGGLPEWIYWHLLTYLTTVFTVSLMSALAAIAIYRVLKKLTDDSYFSAVVVIAIWLGTLLFPFSTLFYSHVPASSLLAIVFYLLFEIRWSDPAIAGRPLVYGCFSGATMAHYLNRPQTDRGRQPFGWGRKKPDDCAGTRSAFDSRAVF